MPAITFSFARSVLPLVLVSLLLIGCGGAYQYTFNERVIHDPFGRTPQEALLADANLEGCIRDLLSRSEHSAIEDITLLSCAAGGVDSIHGIFVLSALEQLELSDNGISDLTPLNELDGLRVLSLRNNDVVDIRPLLKLPLLRFVSLQGNNRIPCRQLNELEERIGNGLGRPQTCSS